MHENSLPCGDRDDEYTEMDSAKLTYSKDLRQTVEIISPEAVWRNADIHGWHNPPASLNEDLLLIHSEISEATEGARKGLITSADGKGSVGEELADAVIRIFHTSRKNGIDIIGEIAKKHNINMSRPYRHDNKKF